MLDPTLSAMVRCGMYGNWVRDRSDGGAPNNVSSVGKPENCHFPSFWCILHNAIRPITHKYFSHLTCVNLSPKLHSFIITLQPKFLTHNAQYLITQQHCDEDTCLVSLVQRFRPRSTPHEGYMCIGFVVFKVRTNHTVITAWLYLFLIQHFIWESINFISSK